ncbi:MAG: aldo/keto reductase [Rhodospirillaceae bacterium]|jgi:aryl-alcohol dehydrogenase-like predicted oxidoreductase|nr:aldo/keto reductase [Alphaproteobacteria bacterium]MBT4934370.1 aldo/keto reductase [Rhodospirillaceae bacterium]MBT5245219.1 aldo/keto reductase [Rhodospirillaceae bacterium]MBT5561945.1 aldo/keto reductase [Rhodospirillaceae bacterium]MBT6241937.1 aldo/keto reductase [Rhodospirillaceae bacterium]
MKLTRKEFLKLSASAGAALAMGAMGAMGSTDPANAAQPMARRAIPKSGEMLPVVGLGTSRVFDVAGEPEEMAERRKVMQTLFDGGGSVIDSAPTYGNSETIAGRLLDQMGARDKTFIATKISTWGDREDGLNQMKGSMGRWHTGKIDLMQVHNLKGTDMHLESIRQWRDAGRIRYVGITHYRDDSHEDLEMVLQSEVLDFVQLNYSVLNRNAEKILLPLAAEKGVAVLVNVPFGRGGLFRMVRGKEIPDWAAEFGASSWGQIFLKYILANPAVTCVIPGTSKAKHMIDNVGAGQGLLPDARQRRKILDLMENL